MQVINKLYPDGKEQTQGAAAQGPEGPIYMLNLLKFRDRAVYADGRETDLSGHDAYMIYAKAVARLIVEYGGKLEFMAYTSFLQIGDVEELWDEVAIASYPSRRHLYEMSTSAAWQEIAVHREAGLAGQLNIEMVKPEKVD